MVAYTLTEARSHLGELVNIARIGREHVTITEHGKPVAVIVGFDELAVTLEQYRALASFLADKEAGRVTGVRAEDLDAAALDAMDAQERETHGR